MQIRSYVVRYDGGFAPNPFAGFLTLATCKPQIRKHSSVGDLIVGTGSVESVGSDRLVFAAKITAVVPIQDYGSLSEYADKRPKLKGENWRRYGDNYYTFENGHWHQKTNLHHKIDQMPKDLSGLNVLVCDEFWYFGCKAKKLPKRFLGVVKSGPGHKIIDDVGFITDFWIWLNKMERGLHSQPYLSKSDETKSCTKVADQTIQD